MPQKKMVSSELMVVIFIVSILCAPAISQTCQDQSKYGFESEIMGWVEQTYWDSQAVTAVAQSENGTAKIGCHSLKLFVDLDGNSQTNSKGEAYVDMQNNPPTGIVAPIDLTGVTITVWVYAPKEAIGDPRIPNGVQVFVKDQDWNSEYGAWNNLDSYSTDKWIQISLTPKRTCDRHECSFMTSGFDPSKIIAIGVKIGAGGSSTATFKGSIYVDGVNW